MIALHKVVKYCAMAFAVFLAVSIIGGLLSILGLFTGLLEDDAVATDLRTYAVSSEIRVLEVNINAADFKVKQGEDFLVESNLKHLAVEEKDGVLSLEETKKFGGAYRGASLTLYIPADITFEKIIVRTGAGKLTVERLSSGTVELDLGAGEVIIESLIATSCATIDGGAGKITVVGGELHNLAVDMGVGQLHLTSALTGDCSFDLGVGESNVTVIGDRENYKLHLEKGIGGITVDGKSVPDLKEQGSKENSIEISGGIGAVNLNFEGSCSD